MGCAIGIVKYVVFLFNLVFALAGLALLVIGVLFKLGIDDITNAIDENHRHTLGIAPTLLIVVGSIVFIISFFGCCGAVRESTCMLTTYAIILLAIFILQVAVGVYAFLQIRDSDGSLEKELTNGLQTTFNNFGSDPISTDSINILQQKLECCGFKNPNDIFNKSANAYPDSCCENNTSCPPGAPGLFKNGCSQKFIDFILDTIKIIGIVAISIAATEIIGAIFALCLSSSIRNENRRGGYA